MSEITDEKFVKFPSIGHLKNLYKEVKYVSIPEELKKSPTEWIVDYTGTVKMHGSCSSIIYRPSEPLQYQSRNLIINNDTKWGDFCEKNKKTFDCFFRELNDRFSEVKMIAIFGEFCGPKITKGVGISDYKTNFFVIFNVKISTLSDTEWMCRSYWRGLQDIKNDIYNINNFSIYHIKVDLLHPENSIQETQKIAEEIGNDCPVARELGTPGNGEGIVWTPLYPHLLGGGSRLWFKSKCKAHSVTRPTNPKISKNNDEEFIIDFVESNMNQNRMNNCLDMMREKKFLINKENLGIFLKLLVDDIINEEGSNIDNKLVKKVKKSISERGRIWYWSKCEEHI